MVWKNSNEHFGQHNLKQRLKRIFSNVLLPHFSPIIIKNILNKPRFSRVEAFLVARGIESLNFQGPLKGTWHQLVSSSARLTAARTVTVVLSWQKMAWRVDPCPKRCQSYIRTEDRPGVSGGRSGRAPVLRPLSTFRDHRPLASCFVQ